MALAHESQRQSKPNAKSSNENTPVKEDDRAGIFRTTCSWHHHRFHPMANGPNLAALLFFVGKPIEEDTQMPQAAHNQAAEHHENAAKSHRAAAEQHGRGDHKSGLENSTKAHGQSNDAHKSSTDAHSKSSAQK
jgi:hypothetical protein